MQQTRAKMRAAIQPTGRPHPLLTADAAEQTAKAADQLAADTAREYRDDSIGLSPDGVVTALPGAVAAAMQKALPHRYTPELAAEFATEMIARLTGAKTDCPVFADCTDTTPGHYDHYSHDIKVTGEDGSTILDIGMVAVSGSEHHAIVYLRNEEFTTAAALRAKTAELRLLLDQADEMADRVLGVEAGE
ncbi:hypothetical protein [Streptomyces heilongjiangensis]|uniref:Uncharacterized protein n=1 Tax=Streptomyces heilongjiangensis TaxID=945052 RepID=A0ABW1B542_9ACTN|nr:hypothetical protein [Streptomyces heilongjiangensis]MDC2951760.1 hypothetical protein [Streptomyces heilongjiangensis]